MSDMQLREIETTDLPAVAGLLKEGFPRRRPAYWDRALSVLEARPRVEGYPRFGFVLEVDGKPEGVMLLLSSRIGGEVRSNLSSWYVREAHRKYATFMFQRTIKARGGVYLNLSPSQAALPIAEAFGFRPYTDGTLLIDMRRAVTPVSGVQVGDLTAAGLAAMPDNEDREVVARHLAVGCRGLCLQDEQGAMAALWRIKRLKRLVPAARFVAGDPARLVAAAGPLMRALALRGVPMALIDAPPQFAPPPGIRAMPERERRYFKGAPPPAPGDLLETEIALFGP